MSKNSKSLTSRVCCFCGLSEDNEVEFGKFYDHNGIVTHYYCLLLSSNMEQKGNDDEGILGFLTLDIQKELRRGKRLVCSYCKKSGATLGCCNTKCKKIFHYPCGLRAGSLHQFFGEFRSFCVSHRPAQKIDDYIQKEITEANDVLCYICYDKVNPCDTNSTLWAPCCKKNAWFHRKCIQQLALSAGYFFKCPLCNNKKKFQSAMLEHGIFIPSQDASWELVPNAFQELLYRHDQCDAPECLCPKGRKHTSSNAKWELTLCRICGSQGIHMACGQLKWANPVWECTECISILRKSKDGTGLHRTQDIVENDSTSRDSDSDSDISVGTDVPLVVKPSTPNCSSTSYQPNIKLRPGPRSFKLQQEVRANQMLNVTHKHDNKVLRTTADINSTLNSRESFAIKSNSLSVNEESVKCEETVSRLSLNPTGVTNDIIMIDSDDDVIEITPHNQSKYALPNSTANETKKVSQFNNSNFQVSENATIVNSNSLSIKNLLHTNSVGQNNYNNSPSADLTKTDATILTKLSSFLPQDKRTTENVYNDFSTDIKIVNVTSLAPEEFADVSIPTDIQTQKEVQDDVVSESQFVQSDVSEKNLKRKLEHAHRENSTPVLIDILDDKSKKMKAYAVSSKPTFNSVALENSIFNENDAGNNNINRQHFSLKSDLNNISYVLNNSSRSSTVQNDGASTSLYIPKKKETINTSEPWRIEVLNKVLNRGTDEDIPVVLSEYIMNIDAITNNKNNSLQARNVQTENCTSTSNCDGDAGTSPAVKLGGGNLNSDQFKDSQPGKSFETDFSSTSNERKENSFNMAADNPIGIVSQQIQNNGISCDHSRLIPKYIRVQDLKFRVNCTDSLQMILYNKYSVNINMDTVIKRHTVQDTSKITVSKAQNEISPIANCEDISNRECINKQFNPVLSTPSTNNKEKYKSDMLTNEKIGNFHDDTKENLDPVATISSINTSSNQVDQGNTEITEADTINKWYNRESSLNINVESNSNNAIINKVGQQAVHVDCIENFKDRVNSDSIFASKESSITGASHADASTDNEFSGNIKCVKPNVQSCEYVSSSTIEEYIEKADTEQVSNNLMEQVCSTLSSGNSSNCIPQDETKNKFGTHIRISIDLNRIQGFIDSNPDLFLKHKRKDKEHHYKRIGFLMEQNDTRKGISLRSRHVDKSIVDESKHFTRFNFSPSNARIRQLVNCGNENVKNTMVTEKNLVQETKYVNNSLSSNKKRGMKRTSRHLENQCVFNR